MKTHMTDPQAFVREILEHPDDDAPRLIYADWLEERGDPRGEFIRVQCELARLPRAADRRRPLETRENKLLLAHAGEWRAELLELPDIVWGLLARGFMSSVHTPDGKKFAAQAERVFAAAPVEAIRFIQLNATELRRLMRSDHAWRLRGLNLSHAGLGNRAIEELAAEPSLGRLTGLNLQSLNLSAAAARALAASPHAASLLSLDLSYNAIGNAGVQALATSLHLASLTELILHHNRISAIGVRALAESPYLRHLELLDLRHNDIVAPGPRILTQRFGDRVLL